MQIGPMTENDFLASFLNPSVFLGVICHTEDEVTRIYNMCKERAGEFGITFRSSQKDGHEFWGEAVGYETEYAEIGVDYYKNDKLMYSGLSFYVEDESGDGFDYIYYDDIVDTVNPVPCFDGLF